MLDLKTLLENPKKLSFQERFELVGGLLACLTMCNRDSREAVLQQLDSQISDLIPRHTVDRIDVANIVTTCLNYPDGIKSLIIVVKFFEGDSMPMQQLEKLIQKFFFVPQVINQGLFSELTMLAAKIKVSKNDLRKAYYKSVPPEWPTPEPAGNDEVETLTLMIRDLAQAGLQANNTLPLLTFVKFLSRHVPEQSAQSELALWMNRVEKDAGIKNTSASSGEEGLQTDQFRETSCYLLVTFNPDCNDQNRMYIQAWFLSGQKEDIVCLNVNEDPYTLDAISKLLDNLLMQCEAYMSAMSTLIVELFLPFAFLSYDNYDVHQWMIDAGFGNRSVISIQYPLVVRSFDRAYRGNPRVKRAWRRNWCIVEETKAINEPRFLRIQDCNREVLLEDITCLTFTFVPPPILDISKPHILTKMISAGTSIALWPRSQGEGLSEEEVEKAYKALLSGCKFSKLPKTIWERRKHALENKSLLENRLTLFWDDPNRLPPDVQGNAQLMAPQRKGNEQ